MTDSFIGEIRAFPYSYVPQGWLLCNGGIYSITGSTGYYNYNCQALYSIIGNTYGGDSTKGTFAVPKLNGIVLAGMGVPQPGWTNYQRGVNVGDESVQLSVDQMPTHNHTLNGATGGGNQRTNIPGNNTYLTNFGIGTKAVFGYVPGAAGVTTTLSMQTLGSAGSGQAHENRSPFLSIGFFICFEGVYPTQV